MKVNQIHVQMVAGGDFFHGLVLAALRVLRQGGSAPFVLCSSSSSTAEISAVVVVASPRRMRKKAVRLAAEEAFRPSLNRFEAFLQDAQGAQPSTSRKCLS